MVVFYQIHIRYTVVEKPLYILKRFLDGCSAAVKSSSNRYHLRRSIISHRNHIFMAVPTATTSPWPYSLQSHGHGRTHCSHIAIAMPIAITSSWPYPLQPHSHGRTHCSHIVMAVPTATTWSWAIAITSSWPYPLQPHGHGPLQPHSHRRTHCNHMVMDHCSHTVIAVPTAAT